MTYSDFVYISYFDAQLPQPHTYGHDLVNTVLIVSEILAMVGSDNKNKS